MSASVEPTPAPRPEEFQVEQPSYRGPIELLLQLVRRSEIAPESLELGAITEQYLGHLEHLDDLDVDRASEFLLVATILVELKSRQLLVEDTAEPLEDDDLGLPGDLIRDLLAYRQLRDQTKFLDDLQGESLQRFVRGPSKVSHAEHYGEFLDDLSSWDLYEAFNQLQRQLMTQAPRIVTADETPIEEHMVCLRKALKVGEKIPFAELFADLGGVVDRGIWIGRFLAVLELAKRQEITIHQDEAFGAIAVEARP